ncbi:thioredoxin-like domain-containing protein [Runella slithyformis]|uniref:Alkyl hydroperoxide reductase/ Thiol specific antioxidant/ Mal allergen n=1 Tax=Runella slithyformis (strain ATCC 29530 / DSM 19594 / LMG 11500 / NCIMB 11436 / LSU 4) TaxID=761193 RepID=A0A7U3ZG05_RUNSL|nr:thioredoxin-like domain-containing protein [Runella slithyformis]AEI46538.1 alkyl hydroperoxide reductase/ Thiol specific antioxidant/ Mal allergen [Runella slithyformis DSM 19594]
MKFKRILLSSLVCLANAAIAQSAYRIEGQIKGLKGGSCILANYYAAQIYAKDTAQADNNGHFVFEGTKPLPGGVYEVVLPDRRTLYRVLIADDQDFSFAADTTDIVGSMKVKGSRDNELFYDFQRFMKGKEEEYQKLKAQKVADSDKRYKDIQDQRKAYYDSFMKANEGTFTVKLFKASAEPELPTAPKLPNGKTDSAWVFNYYKSHYWDNFDFGDVRMLQTPFLHQKLERYLKDLTVQTEDSLIKEADFIVNKAIKGTQKDILSYCIWYITNQYEMPKTVGTEGVFVHMGEKYYLTGIMPVSDSATIKNIAERIRILKPLLVNKIIPDLGVMSYRAPDKLEYIHASKADYEILFFYSPTCGHCRESAPKLKAFHDKMHAQGVDVLTIAIDGKEDEWRKFVKEFKLETLNNGFGLVASRQVVYRNDYDVLSTPTVYVLDKNKKIIARRLGVEDLEPFLNVYKKRLAMEPKPAGNRQ